MVGRIDPLKVQLNKAYASDTETNFLFKFIYFKRICFILIYEKRDDFDFDVVNFPFLDGDVPHSTSYGVYISQLNRFPGVSSHVTDFNARNNILASKLLRQGYRYHKLRKTFSKFYLRNYKFLNSMSE